MSGRALCTVDKCDAPQVGRGWCSKHYQRWKRTGDPVAVSFIVGDDQARLLAKVTIDSGGCWLWTGQINRYGYAKTSIRRNGKDVHVSGHRLAYELFIGPIPVGQEIDHVKARGCLYRHCVNPAHLEAVTPRENTLRSTAPSALNATKTHCPAGHEYDEVNTRIYRGRRHCRACDRSRLARRRTRIAA